MGKLTSISLFFGVTVVLAVLIWSASRVNWGFDENHGVSETTKTGLAPDQSRVPSSKHRFGLVPTAAKAATGEVSQL